MKRGKLRLLAGVLALLAALGGVAVTASPAMAADSCYGDYCSGRDPSTTGVGGMPCANDARTVASADINQLGGQLGPISIGGGKVGVLELRWSARCGTNWARLNTTWGGNYRHLTVNQQSTNYTQTNELLAFGYYYLPAGIYYTNMVYSPTLPAQAVVNTPPWWVGTTWV